MLVVFRETPSERTECKFSTAHFGKVDRRRRNHLVCWWKKTPPLHIGSGGGGVDGLGVGRAAMYQ